ncbi:MAG: NADH-quinone oxidoreductase subunit NuoG [bacterium]
MPTIHVDGKPYEVEEGRNLLHACLSLGFDLPYFCWHPALGSVGACRQCAVKMFKDEKDTRGRIVMACMTPAADGTRISIEDPEAKEFRASVIEWLMINHPHDCPVCDEGGECHLQDMTVMTGHVHREYRFRKRTYRNQHLGPFVNHEMNRCIQCYRCVRFYCDYAGGRDFGAFGIRDRVYFGRHRDGTLENEFSGNLVEVCPTGVFTDKTLQKHYTRKWDLQTAPSVCAHCGVGCGTIPGERYGALRRIRNRYSREVNGYFLCDRGRYGYEFVNGERRIRQPLVRGGPGAPPGPADRAEALSRAASFLGRKGWAIGIGSPRASLESNFALRELVGPDRFCMGLCRAEASLLPRIADLLRSGPARPASVLDVQEADAVLVLGEDVAGTAPRIALALRQRVPAAAGRRAGELHIARWNDAAFRHVLQNARAELYLATSAPSRLDGLATATFRGAPQEVARLGWAIAFGLTRGGPTAVPGLSEETRSLADAIAEGLKRATRPVIVSGTGSGSAEVLKSAGLVAQSLCRAGLPARLCLVVPEWNSLGLALLGGGRLREALALLEQGAADTLVVLENDLFRRVGPAQAEALLAAARHLIVVDHVETETSRRAAVVLPAATFAEASGTVVNFEGRAQRHYQVLAPQGEVQASWRWLRDLTTAEGSGPQASPWQDLDDLDEALARSVPALAGILEAAPPADWRAAGMKIARQPHRYSGRTAMFAHLSVHEPMPPEDPDSPLRFSMEGFEGRPPPALVPRFWAPGWNSVQALNKFQSEVGGPLCGGEPGRRLIGPAPQEGRAAAPDEPAPAAFVAREGRWLVVPLHEVFGSEELSSLSPGIAERSPRPYVALSPGEAAGLGAAGGDELEVEIDGRSLRLPVRETPGLPQGVGGIPVGLQGLVGLDLPSWAKIRKPG